MIRSFDTSWKKSVSKCTFLASPFSLRIFLTCFMDYTQLAGLSSFLTVSPISCKKYGASICESHHTISIISQSWPAPSAVTCFNIVPGSYDKLSRTFTQRGKTFILRVQNTGDKSLLFSGKVQRSCLKQMTEMNGKENTELVRVLYYYKSDLY